ncbi:MAG: glycosyltransferase family 9 protein [Planctomycetes bacterium]|nr:glycosyltransferase family 9 protein [Planctomycetota bacterium]
MTLSDASESARLIAVRLPNWVGDVCMALPALALLRREGHELRIFGKGWATDLLAGMPFRVEKLPAGVRAGARVLRESGAHAGLLFTNSFGSALAMRLAGIRATGYRGECRSPLLGRAVKRLARVHEVESFWNLALAHVGHPTGSRPPNELGLLLSDAHREAARSSLAAAGVDRPYVVLCPLAAGLVDGHSKVWPGFPLLCRGLIEGGARVVACPGPGEERACAAALPGAVLLSGLGLGAYAAVLAGARFAVANDSGPMHLAAAVGTPVVGVFGVSDPHRTAPWHDGATVCGSAAGWPSAQTVSAAIERLPAH